jgi:hypothetical protein
LRFLLVFFIFASIACSKVELGLRYADTGVWWKLTGYIDYQSPNRKKARVVSDAMVNRFLKENLGNIATLLEKFEHDKNVEVFYSRFIAQLELAARRQQNDIDELIYLIENPEFESLIENYSAKIKKQQELIGNRERMLKDLGKKYIDFLEMLIGDLEDSQAKEVEIFFQNAAYPFEDDILQKKTYLELIKSTQGEQKRLLKLGLEFFSENNKLQSSQLYEDKKKFVGACLKMTQKIFDGLTDRQKSKLHMRILEISNVFKAWIADHT